MSTAVAGSRAGGLPTGAGLKTAAEGLGSAAEMTERPDHSASRALAILEALNARPVSFVRDIARQTNISKPSIVRLLGILMEDGYVERASDRGAYVLGERARRLSVGYRDGTALVRIAKPLMERMTAEIKWPLALGLLERAVMVVRHSTIPSSPLAWYHTTLYSELSVLQSGMGMAMLAFMAPDRRDVMIAAAPSRFAFNAPAPDRATLLRTLEGVREQGFAVRYPSLDHATLSVSVPILCGGEPMAGLSVTVFSRVMRADAAAETFSGPMTRLAAAISLELDGGAA